MDKVIKGITEYEMNKHKLKAEKLVRRRRLRTIKLQDKIRMKKMEIDIKV